jgi:hypothetical protein
MFLKTFFGWGVFNCFSPPIQTPFLFLGFVLGVFSSFYAKVSAIPAYSQLRKVVSSSAGSLFRQAHLCQTFIAEFCFWCSLY